MKILRALLLTPFGWINIVQAGEDVVYKYTSDKRRDLRKVLFNLGFKDSIVFMSWDSNGMPAYQGETKVQNYLAAIEPSEIKSLEWESYEL